MNLTKSDAFVRIKNCPVCHAEHSLHISEVIVVGKWLDGIVRVSYECPDTQRDASFEVAVDAK